MEILFSSQMKHTKGITKIICTCHDRKTVMAYANIRHDQINLVIVTNSLNPKKKRDMWLFDKHVILPGTEHSYLAPVQITGYLCCD